MAYVGEPYAFDLFVSYSHGDPDGTGTSKLKQWSQAFARELETELKAYPKFGRDLQIFLDQHHRPSQAIDPLSALTGQLQDDISRSALLTILMSPQYLSSTWCRDERNWWYESQRKLEVPTDGRVAVLRIWPTTDPWPAPLTDQYDDQLPGFCFYDKTNAELCPQPYEWPEPEPTSKGPFRKELLTLVGHISLKLQALRKRLEEQRLARKQAQKLAAASGQLVYLHGRTEFLPSWEQAADGLRQSGLVVMPTEPDPSASDIKRLQELRQLRVQAMSGCDALLLAASPDPRAVEADLVVVGRQDRNSARAMSNSLLPCALIDTIGANVAAPKRKAAAKSLNVEWIDATQPDWPSAVQHWLHDVGREEGAA